MLGPRQDRRRTTMMIQDHLLILPNFLVRPVTTQRRPSKHGRQVWQQARLLLSSRVTPSHDILYLQPRHPRKSASQTIQNSPTELLKRGRGW